MGWPAQRTLLVKAWEGNSEDANMEERRAQVSSPEVTEQGRTAPSLVPKGIAAQLERPDQATALGCDLGGSAGPGTGRPSSQAQVLVRH